jgi:hypothetical protein
MFVIETPDIIKLRLYIKLAIIIIINYRAAVSTVVFIPIR